jgi:AhpD family alkylhydroperoxidase
MNAPRIPSLDPASATGSNKKFFDLLHSALGVVPNMTRSMAQSPAVLEGYVSLNGALTKGSLGKKLGEELALALAHTNRCDYCASAHTVLGKFAGLSETEMTAALNGTVADARTAAALKFANVVVEKPGRINDADFQAVTDAGFTPGEAGEIVAHVALNVFTNYFNNVAGTEIDFPEVSSA